MHTSREPDIANLFETGDARSNSLRLSGRSGTPEADSLDFLLDQHNGNGRVSTAPGASLGAHREATRSRRTERKSRKRARQRKTRGHFLFTVTILATALVAALLIVWLSGAMRDEVGPLRSAEPGKRMTPEQPAQVAPPPAEPANTAEPEPEPDFDTGRLWEELRRITGEGPGEYGVTVVEPKSGESVSMNADREFYAASLGKLPTLITLYRMAAEGELDLEEPMTMEPADVQSYGAGVLHLYPAGSTWPLKDLAYYLIKESDNTAWVMLNRRLGEDRIQEELDRIGAAHTDFSRITTTPNDVLLMLETISDPEYTSREHSEEMLDFMTGTSYEDRIPAGLPEDVRVAHKVGSDATSYADAGLVYYDNPETGSGWYFLVIIATGADEAVAREKMREISLESYRAMADPEAEPRPTVY